MKFSYSLQKKNCNSNDNNANDINNGQNQADQSPVEELSWMECFQMGHSQRQESEKGNNDETFNFE